MRRKTEDFPRRFFPDMEKAILSDGFSACQKSLFDALKRPNAARWLLHFDASIKPKENPDGFLLEFFPSERGNLQVF